MCVRALILSMHRRAREYNIHARKSAHLRETGQINLITGEEFKFASFWGGN